MNCKVMSTHYAICLFILIIAIGTRVYNISKPNYVCWDETHFGKMSGFYINRTFFFDVHPPLGKLIIAGTGFMLGYDGKFAFANAGDYYNVNVTDPVVPYVGMRVTAALFGSMTVPLAYILVFTLSGKISAAILASFFLTFDIGLITLSQYILLDGIFIFFMVLTILSATKTTASQGVLSGFMHCHTANSLADQSFSCSWWLWMILAGISLGCVMATKFVGLFTVVYVGIWTLWDLYNILSDAENATIRIFLKHFSARFFGLILVPVTVYMFIFWIHFQVLCNTGNGAYLFSTAFQAGLKGNYFYNSSIPEFIPSGSLVTVRGSNWDSAILHSHNLTLPKSVQHKQHQQVTGYLASDPNNMWQMRKALNNEDSILSQGDVIQLTHMRTKARLAVTLDNKNQWSKALSVRYLLVAGVHERNIPIGSDQWRIHLIADEKDICTVQCYFYLINVATNCSLHLGSRVLPEWGGKQREINCAKDSRHHNNRLWFVETVVPSISNVTYKHIKTLSFLEKFLEAHVMMLVMNSKLLPKYGDHWSKPWEWPILLEGQLFSRSSDGIYLYGTPLIWAISLISFPLYGLVYLFLSVVTARAQSSSGSLQVKHPYFTYNRDFNACSTLVVAWFIHYAPFYLMQRILFFHHYFPAHVFACSFSAIFLNFLCSNFVQHISVFFMTSPASLHHSTLFVIVALVLGSFYTHIEFCYSA